MFENEYISLASVSARLNLPETYLRKLVDDKLIPHLNINGRMRFQEQAVRDALSDIEQGGRRAGVAGG